MRFLLTAFTGLALLSGFATPAKADYFVWEDPASGLTFSFPDTWEVVSSADPDDVLTIMAPAGRAHAACRVRTNLDRRYLVYPPSYRDAIQKVDYSVPFWEKYMGEFEQPVIHEVKDGAGLGRSYASYAVLGFHSAVQGPAMNRQAIAFASLYNDTLFVLECSSHKDAFMDWKDAFTSIAKSIDFRKTYHENVTGHYRDFLADKTVRLKGDRKGTFIVEY